jgi:hypothetical protein
VAAFISLGRRLLAATHTSLPASRPTHVLGPRLQVFGSQGVTIVDTKGTLLHRIGKDSM